MIGCASLTLFVFQVYSVANGNYLNDTECVKIRNDSTICNKVDEGIWGPLLEEWILNEPHRHGRIIRFPSNEQIYVTALPRVGTGESKTESKISNTKIVNNNNNQLSKPPMKQVTETDLYLLNAIEKLVYRLDFMEKRLKKVEEMLYYVMAGNRMDQEPCLNNYTRIGNNCYLFSYLAGREVDWKVANQYCRKYGAILAEMETVEDNQDVIAHIQTNNHLRGKDFWIGGLNPGLLWIWSNSARPVKIPGNHNGKNTITGNGRCLKLGFNPALRSYTYIGSDCSVRYSFICRIEGNEPSNQINRLSKTTVN